MSKVSGSAPRTFTIAFSDQDKKFEAMPDDCRYARQAARQIGCEHNEIVIQPDIVDLLPKMIHHLDEPLADPAAINVYLISKAAREQGVTVLLNGMGGDEVFGGYRKQLACLLANQYQIVPPLLRKVIQGAINNLPVASKNRGFKHIRWAKRFLSFAELDPTQRFLQADISLSPTEYNDLYTHAADFPYYSLPCVKAQQEVLNSNQGSYLNRMCLRDTRFFLTDHNLLYTDKATMAASIEGRPPLLDHRLVEWAFTLPGDLKIRKKVQKYILKKVAEPYLDKDIIYRPKAPFAAPLRSWIKGELSEMIQDTLTNKSLKERGLYNPQTVHKLINDNTSGVQDNSHHIWTILTRELWFRNFIDTPSQHEAGQPEIVFYETDDAKA